MEAFSSVQGEGMWVGLRHLFLRLAGCNLRCSYCDTPAALEGAGSFVVRRGGQSNRLPPVLLAEEVWQALAVLEPARHHAVSLTGGEPLLQAEFLVELLERAPAGVRFLLETNGTLPGALARVVDRLDFISMDIKLPATTGRDLWAEQWDFLQLARRRPVAVKLVVTAETQATEVERAAGLVAAAGRDIPLVLQPVTEVPGGPSPPPGERLLAWQEMAMELLDEVRVLPQVHRQLGLP